MFRFPKKSIAIVASIPLLGLAACSGPAEPSETNEPVTLRWGLVLNEDHAWYTCGIQTVMDILEENEDAQLSIEVFPGGQLGSNEAMVDSVSQGTLDMTVPGVGSVSGLYAPFGVLEAFFVFDDIDHGFEVWNGPIGEELKQGAIDEANLRVLGDLWYIGTRYVTANKKIETPADLQGLSMRSQDTPASFANISAMGANPTPVDFGELYLALSQGVVDTQENPIPNIVAAKFYEVQDYLMLTAHVPQFGSVLINEDLYQSLSAEQQELLDDAVREAAAEVRECIEKQENEVLEEWRTSPDSPIEVVEVDRDAFQEHALEYFTGPNGPDFADWYKRIRESR